MSPIRFFQPADGGEWHAYRDESAQALCGEATLSYNRDKVADAVPSDGSLHDGCRQAIDAENPAPYTPYVAPETESAEGETEASTEGEAAPETESAEGETEAAPEAEAVTEAVTETQEVGSGDVASLSSVLGESNTGEAADPNNQP